MRAAIETIAELGYAKASFAQIAKRAGLSSTGLISYHFAGRDELIGEVVREVLGAIGTHMAARLAGTDSPPELLRGYILGNVEFIDAHRDAMKALLATFLSGGFAYGPEEERAVLLPLEQILRQGQREGVFRRFDPTVLATLILARDRRAAVPARCRCEHRRCRLWRRGRRPVFELATKAGD